MIICASYCYPVKDQKDHNRIISAMSLFIIHLQGLYSLVSKFHGHLWLMPLMISALIAKEKLKKRRINNNCYSIGYNNFVDEK